MGAREMHGEMAVAVLGEIRRGDVQVLRVSVAGLEGDTVQGCRASERRGDGDVVVVEKSQNERRR
jgi:hypothetical protein